MRSKSYWNLEICNYLRAHAVLLLMYFVVLAPFTHVFSFEVYGEVKPQKRINYALPSNGSRVLGSDSGHRSGLFPLGSVIDGVRNGSKWGRGNGGWNDNSPGAFPDWAIVDFQRPRTIDEINVFTLHDNYGTAITATQETRFSKYGVVDFYVQYWNGSGWVVIQSITGNRNVWRSIKFSPRTTSKIRVVVTKAIDGFTRLTEIEAWGNENKPRTGSSTVVQGTLTVIPKAAPAPAPAPAVKTADGSRVAPTTGTLSVVKPGTPLQLQLSPCIRSNSEQSNFMLNGWNSAMNPLLTSAATEMLRKKGRSIAQLSGFKDKLRRDPVLRWEFAPFMIKAAWNALTVGSPNSAQSSFRRMFENWYSCEEQRQARLTLIEWERFKGNSNFTLGNQQINSNSTLTVLTDTGPSAAKFLNDQASRSSPWGPQGAVEVGKLYLPMMDNLGAIDENNLFNLEALGKDMADVVVGAGIGTGVGSAAALGGGFIGAMKGIVAIRVSTILADKIAPATKALEGVALIDRLKHIDKLAKQFATRILGNAMKFASVITVISVIITAAQILGMVVADFVKTQEFDKNLREKVSNLQAFNVNQFINQPSVDDKASAKTVLFTSLMKFLIADPAQSSGLTLKLPSSTPK